MVKIDMKVFRPVEFKMNALTIKAGGSLKKEAPLITNTVMTALVEGEQRTFVQIRTREPWLTQAVGDSKSHRSDMLAGVLKDLRLKVSSMEDCRRKNIPDPIDLNTEDPMDEMDVVGESRVVGPKRKRWKGKFRFPVEVVQIKMWEWPPEVASFTTVNQERFVQVFLEGQGRLWLDKDDLEWLIRSLWVQQRWRCLHASDAGKASAAGKD